MVFHLEVCTHSGTSFILFTLVSSSGHVFCADVLLCSVGECLIQWISNELTSSLPSNWRNSWWTLFSYWLRLMVKTACLVHVFSNGTDDFWKARKLWKTMTAQVIRAHQTSPTTTKTC